MDSIDLTYKSIGEFVVTFQWIESIYREIGWLILDPVRKSWPPMELRKETTAKLIDRVTELYCDLVDKYDIPIALDRKRDFLALQKEFQALRKYRNRILHSAVIELKAGREVVGLVRSNARIDVDIETGELILDQEEFTEDMIHAKLCETSGAVFRLGNHLVQLTHWAPFTQFKLRHAE